MMGGNEICVPEAALSSDTEQGGMVAPAPGDEVELSSVRGQVTRAENGQIYLRVTEANGVPVDEPRRRGDAEEGEMDAALERGDYAGALLVLLLLLGIGFASPGRAADLQFAENRYCSGTLVSNHVALASPQQVHHVEIDNYSGATLYLMIFDSATNQLAGAVPHVTPIPVVSGSVVGKDWGPQGLPFQYGVNVCLSTTPRSLTNSSNGGIATLGYSRRK